MAKSISPAQQAEAFCDMLAVDYPLRRVVLELVTGAWKLYFDNWYEGRPHQRMTWEWPFTTLKEGGDFEGNEPWTVLLREAVRISTAYHVLGP